MNKFFTVVALSGFMLSAPSHSMEIKQLVKGEGISIFSVTLPPSPEKKIPQALTLYQCGVCQKRCTQTCAQCKGAYYCSTVCQAKDWPTHKEDCNKLKMAHKGDQYQMERFLSAYANILTKTTIDLETTQKARQALFTWFTRLTIRTIQDSNCNNDRSGKAPISLIKKYFDCITQTTSLLEPFSQINAQQYALDAYAWTEHIGSHLVEPCSMQHLEKNYIRPSHDASLFKPDDQWNQLRFNEGVPSFAATLLKFYALQADALRKERLQHHVNTHVGLDLN